MSLGKIALLCTLICGAFIAALIYMTSDASERNEMEEELRKNKGKGLTKASGSSNRSGVRFPPKGRSRKYAHELLSISWPKTHAGRHKGNLVLSLRGNGASFHERSMLSQDFVKSQLGVDATSKVLAAARSALSAADRTPLVDGFALAIDDELGKLRGELSESEVKTILQAIKGTTKTWPVKAVTLRLVPLNPAASPVHPPAKWPLSAQLYEQCVKEPTRLTGTSAQMKQLLDAARKGQALRSGDALNDVGAYEVHVPEF